VGKTTRLALVIVLLFIVGAAVLLEERNRDETVEIASSQTPLKVNTGPNDPLAQWGFRPENSFHGTDPDPANETGTSSRSTDRTRDEPVSRTRSEEPSAPRRSDPPSQPPGSGGEYRVVTGDTLGAISRRVYGSQRHWRRILEANRDRLSSPERLRPGMILILPESGSTIESMPPTAVRRSEPSEMVKGGKVFHLVQNNERLWDIARRYYGSGAYWRTIVDLNPGLDPSKMRVGREILVGDRSRLKGGW
jgi:nucleoid-associated protein YgaU